MRRRNFLKTLGGIVAGAAIAKKLPAAEAAPVAEALAGERILAGVGYYKEPQMFLRSTKEFRKASGAKGPQPPVVGDTYKVLLWGGGARLFTYRSDLDPNFPWVESGHSNPWMNEFNVSLPKLPEGPTYYLGNAVIDGAPDYGPISIDGDICPFPPEEIKVKST
jgi:hypothetical protein